MKRLGILGLALAFLLAATTWRATPAFALDEFAGPTDTADFDHRSGANLYGFNCRVVAAYVTDGQPIVDEYNVRGSVSCRTGRLQGDVNLHAVYFFAPYVPTSSGATPQCRHSIVVDNDMDDADDREFAFSTDSKGDEYGNDTSGCFQENDALRPLTSACIVYGDNNITDCQPIELQPPDAVDPANVPPAEVSSCPRGAVLPPWVQEPVARGTSGAWRWEFDVTLRVEGLNARTNLTVGGINPYLYFFIGFQGVAGLGNDFDVLTPGASGTETLTGKDTIGILIDRTTPLASVKVRVRTDLYTGAVGSVAFAYTNFTAGTYTAPVNNSYDNSMENYAPGTFNEAFWVGASNRGARYAGHNRPSWCYISWGTNWWTSDTTGEAAQLGNPVPQVEGDPPPYVAPVAPPTIVFNPPGETCPEGATCYEPPVGTPDDEAPSVPDPDSEGCGFSITDPSTWGGQIICAIVSLFKGLFSLLGELLDFLGGLLAALTDLLLSLFVPNPDVLTDAIETLKSLFTDGPIGSWLDAFAPPGAGGGGALMKTSGGTSPTSLAASSTSSCEGPEIDFGDLGMPAGVVPTEPIHPFDACTGTTATVAENVRKWTGIGIWIGSGFKILEMVLGSFGAMRQVRIMSGHDWVGSGSGRLN